MYATIKKSSKLLKNLYLNLSHPDPIMKLEITFSTGAACRHNVHYHLISMIYDVWLFFESYFVGGYFVGGLFWLGCFPVGNVDRVGTAWK